MFNRFKRVIKDTTKTAANITNTVVNTTVNVATTVANTTIDTVNKVNDIINVADRPEFKNRLNNNLTFLYGCRITELSILSSHNTYLENIQILSKSSVEAIKTALNRGIRCIELDVFADGDKVIVAHGAPKAIGNQDLIITTTINFEEVIQMISEEAFKNTELPLFICIENNTEGNINANNNMARIIREKLSERLINNRTIPTTLLGQLLNKVVIMSGGGGAGDFINLVNVFWSDNGVHNISSARITPNNPQLVRVYPEGNLSGVLSLNYDGVKFINSGCNFVSMNTQCFDNEYLRVIQRFGSNAIIRVK